MATTKRENVVGLIGLAAGLVGGIFAAGQMSAPIKTMPGELRDLHGSVSTLEKTMLKLDGTVTALAQSIQDARLLRTEFNQFRMDAGKELGIMRNDVDRLNLYIDNLKSGTK